MKTTFKIIFIIIMFILIIPQMLMLSIISLFEKERPKNIVGTFIDKYIDGFIDLF